MQSAAARAVYAGNRKLEPVVIDFRFRMFREVEINRHKHLASRHADQRAGILRPKEFERARIGGSGTEAAWARRRLIYLPAWEARVSVGGELHRCRERFATHCVVF